MTVWVLTPLRVCLWWQMSMGHLLCKWGWENIKHINLLVNHLGVRREKWGDMGAEKQADWDIMLDITMTCLHLPHWDEMDGAMLCVSVFYFRGFLLIQGRLLSLTNYGLYECLLDKKKITIAKDEVNFALLRDVSAYFISQNTVHLSEYINILHKQPTFISEVTYCFPGRHLDLANKGQMI